MASLLKTKKVLAIDFLFFETNTFRVDDLNLILPILKAEKAALDDDKEVKVQKFE